MNKSTSEKRLVVNTINSAIVTKLDSLVVNTINELYIQLENTERLEDLVSPGQVDKIIIEKLYTTLPEEDRRRIDALEEQVYELRDEAEGVQDQFHDIFDQYLNPFQEQIDEFKRAMNAKAQELKGKAKNRSSVPAVRPAIPIKSAPQHKPDLSYDKRITLARTALASEEAVAAVNYLKPIDPQTAESQYLIGYACLIGNDPKAASFLRASIRMGWTSGWSDLERALERLEDPHEIREFTEKMFREEFDEAKVWDLRGAALIRREKTYEEGFACYEQSLRIGPRDEQKLIKLGRSCLSIGRDNDAHYFASEILSLHPHRSPQRRISKPTFDYLMAVFDRSFELNWRQGDYSKIVSALTIAARNPPKNIKLWTHVLEFYEFSGRDEVAKGLRKRLAEFKGIV